MWFQRIVEIETEERQEISSYSMTRQAVTPVRKPLRKATGPTISPGDFQRVKLMRKELARPTEKVLDNGKSALSLENSSSDDIGGYRLDYELASVTK